MRHDAITAQGLFDGLSGKAVAAITTPTVAGTVIATIVVMILIIGAIIFLVNKNCQCRVKPRVGLSCSNQHVMSGYEQSYNNSVNERIARNLEMGAYTG